MKKLLFIYAILLGAFLIYLYGAHFKGFSSDSLSQNSGGSRGDMNERYVMVTFQTGMDYWKSALKGFEDAASDLNVSIDYRGATQYDVNEQIKVLEQVIAKKPAGIAVSAINPNALNETINKAVEQGIPVVTFDSDAPLSEAYTFSGTNNYNAGVTAAHEMANMLDEKGKVAVVTLLNQLNHQERTKGFIETIYKDYPGIEIVGIKDGKGDQLISQKVTSEILEAHEDLAGIFMTEGNGGAGAGEAIREFPRAKEVKIISFDIDTETLDMVKEGTIAATMAQGTWNMGYWSLQLLFQHQHRLNPSAEEDMYVVSQLPAYVDTGISVVTKENVEDYYAK